MSKYIRRKINLFQTKHNTLLPDDFEFHFNIRPVIANTGSAERIPFMKHKSNYRTFKILYKDYK